MRLEPRWIVLDLADTGTGDMMVHSIGGRPCERTMRRAIKAGELRLDREGALAIVNYANTRACNLPGVHAEHHTVVHPEYGPTAIAIWLHEDPPTERPVLNSWVLDMDALTTVTAGDDVSIIGDGRHEGEQRPVQDLWRWLSPPDATALVMDYKRSIVEPDNAWTGIEWTLHPPGAEPVHLFSGGRLRVQGSNRLIVGTSVVLDKRTEQPPDLMGPLVAFSGITLAIVNRDAQTALTSVGADAPLSYQALHDLVSEYDLHATGALEVTLDGTRFDAEVVPLTAADPGPATVMLRRKETQ